MYQLSLKVAAAILLFTSCADKQKKKEQEAEIFPVMELKARDTMLQKEYVTQIQAFRNVEIRSKVNGFLERVLVDEGQMVKTGQVLFQLNSEPYKVVLEKALAAVRSAEAEALTAKVEVNRVKQLVEKNVISKTELQLAEAKLEIANAKIRQAKAEEADARLHLEYTVIRSPFNGMIDRLPLKLGSLIEEGTLLTSIADVSSVFAYFNLSENEYLHFMRSKNRDSISKARNLELILSDGSLFPVKGTIETMEGQIDQATGSIAFRAVFGNPNDLLKHGASGRVVITSLVSGALLVPQKSVFEIQDKNYVYLVNDSGKAQSASIDIQTRVGDFYLIRSGLSEGDKIVYEGIQRIKEGSIIAMKMVSGNAEALAAYK